MSTIWLLKTEPDAFSIDDLRNCKNATSGWDGVRNYQARNNLRLMKVGDLVFFYHSVVGKHVLGIAIVTKEHTPEITDDKGDWSIVELKPMKALTNPVDLATLKSDPQLSELALVKHSRLSVMPVTSAQFHHILKLSGTKL